MSGSDLSAQALIDKKRESLFTAVYIGAILILIALVYFINLPSNIWQNIVDFFMSLTLMQVPGTPLFLPAPQNPAAYIGLYNAAFEVALGIGFLEVMILLLRVTYHSGVKRKAETIENIVFWLGSSYLVTTYLVNMTIPGEWFVFWAGIILIFGLALLARGFVLLANKQIRR
jgi:hypothetical protein